MHRRPWAQAPTVARALYYVKRRGAVASLANARSSARVPVATVGCTPAVQAVHDLPVLKKKKKSMPFLLGEGYVHRR